MAFRFISMTPSPLSGADRRSVCARWPGNEAGHGRWTAPRCMPMRAGTARCRMSMPERSNERSRSMALARPTRRMCRTRYRRSWPGARIACNALPRPRPSSSRGRGNATSGSRSSIGPRSRRARRRRRGPAASRAGGRLSHRRQVLGRRTRYLTDEDSRIMPVAGGGFEQAYNAQAAVATDMANDV